MKWRVRSARSLAESGSIQPRSTPIARAESMYPVDAMEATLYESGGALSRLRARSLVRPEIGDVSSQKKLKAWCAVVSQSWLREGSGGDDTSWKGRRASRGSRCSRSEACATVAVASSET